LFLKNEISVVPAPTSTSITPSCLSSSVITASVVVKASVRMPKTSRPALLTLLTRFVVTGGGVSYLRGIEDLGKRIFGLPVRIGQPNYIGVKEPIFSTSVGMVNYVLKRKFDYFIEYNNVDNKKSRYKNKTKSNINMVSLVKKVWNEYF